MDRNRRVFGALRTFDEVFPEIRDVSVEYTESGAAETKIRMAHSEPTLEQHSPPYHNVKHDGLIRCGNTMCKRGGYEIDRVLYEMRTSRLTERTGLLSCPGDEGSPKGRKRGGACGNRIQYKILVHYR